MTRSRAGAATAAAIIMLAAGAPGASATGRWTTRIDNRWFPLRPGTTFVYKGVKDGRQTRDDFTVTHRTRRLGGVRCVVIDDRLTTGTRVIERTKDYYVQDRNGAVWYFGEDTAEFDAHGRVISREGTWHAGVHGARPGIFMPAHPRLGEHHRQEFFAGHAEDQFRVQSLDASVTVPFGSFSHALRTREWTALEPGVIDAKYYVKGVGEVLEDSRKGPKERAALVAIRHS
jgi:hypothetical protein